MGLYLSILTVLLLGVVAGLLMAVWWQLRDWKAATREAPLLAERLAEQMISARRGLEELRRALTAQGPEISTLLSEGGKLRVELQFLLQRAEQAAGKLEGKVRGHAPAAAQIAAVEQVAGANGKAVQPSHAAHDPLEDLLAGLQEGAALHEGAADNVTPITKAPRHRVGPVTQAELDLQQKVVNS